MERFTKITHWVREMIGTDAQAEIIEDGVLKVDFFSLQDGAGCRYFETHAELAMWAAWTAERKRVSRLHQLVDGLQSRVKELEKELRYNAVRSEAEQGI